MERDEEYKKKNVWIDQGFLKLGPSGKEKAEYSLNTTKNKEIDMYRKSLAGSQSVTSTARSRRKIEGEAISYGGRVSWEKEKDDKRKIGRAIKNIGKLNIGRKAIGNNKFFKASLSSFEILKLIDL